MPYLLLLLLLAPGAALAQQVTPQQALQAANAKKPEQSGKLMGGAAFGMIGEDLFVTLQLRLSFDFEE